MVDSSDSARKVIEITTKKNFFENIETNNLTSKQIETKGFHL